ncbi:MAG: HI0074 family nucleotidyltransferase substrate-binding subunit [Chitinispirillales bacterium]|nr:HI0074 family nucleotidyltransferase substrate-binding subunit [Chitinispirillales bacterium]
MENKLDITSLKNAANAFYMAIAFADRVEAKPSDKRDVYEFETAHAALIKHFEFCYELCWKTMRRFIQIEDIGKEADILTRKDLFRVAAEKRLIADFDHWLAYHDARNKTSHVYDFKVADNVYQTAKMFAGDLREFVETMEIIEKRI